MKKFAFTLITLLFSTTFAQAEVDQKALKAAMEKLEATASSPVDGDYEDLEVGFASFRKVKVKGKNVEEMLLDYAKKQGYDMSEVKILLRMTKDQIPVGDDGSDVIGLARNIDVAGLAVDLHSSEIDDKKLKALTAKAVTALFEVTGAGALVGVESTGWIACGSTVPSLIILDPETGVVYSLSPNNTDC
jgi:hypothetical protein